MLCDPRIARFADDLNNHVVESEKRQVEPERRNSHNLGSVEMAALLSVRVKSHLEAEDLEHRLSERRPRFLEVPSLLQKIYGRDEASGAYCGVHFF